MENIIFQDHGGQLLNSLRPQPQAVGPGESTHPSGTIEAQAPPAKKKITAKVRQPDGTWKEVDGE
jgi:hypothetical protein